MTILVYLGTMFLNVLFAFREKQSKVIVVFTLVVIGLLMSGAGPAYMEYDWTTIDYQNYQRAYESLASGMPTSTYEIGYTLLMKFGNLLHLNFFIFRLIVIMISLILIYKLVIKRYTDKANYILLMYMSYPMIIDSEHFRNFIGLTILLIAVRFLEVKDRKNMIKFVLMIILAGSFHSAFFLYLPLIFVNSSDKNFIIELFVITAVLFSLMIIVNHNRIPFFSIVSKLFGTERTMSYLNRSTSLGYLIPIGLQSINIMLLYLSRKIVFMESEKSDDLDDLELNSETEFIKQTTLNDGEIVNLIFWINVTAITFFPLFIINIQFYRLIRNFFFLNTIAYSLASSKLRAGSVYKTGFNLLVIGDILLWFYMTLIVIVRVERVVIPFFTQNVF